MSDETTPETPTRATTDPVCPSGCDSGRHYIEPEVAAAMLKRVRGKGEQLAFSFGPGATWIECPFCQPDHPWRELLLRACALWISVMGWGDDPPDVILDDRPKCPRCGRHVATRADGSLKRHLMPPDRSGERCHCDGEGLAP